MATRYCDFQAGNDSNDATSFANRVKTITSGFTAARIAPGDELRIMKSPAPLRVQDSSGTNLNATFTNKSQTVTLSAAATKLIYADGSWTGATADVTCTTSATRKEGSNSSSIAIASAFTTGKAAYFALAGGAQDFSGYTKITFFIRVSASVAASALRLDLCSDATGTTAVNSFTITDALSVANLWVPFTIDNGSALGSSIQSIALTCLSDPGTVTILIDNVLACNRLSLTSLIGKESAEVAYELYPIQSISGTTILTDYNANNGNSTTRGYYGTTETVAIYAREPVTITAAQAPNEAGSAGNINLYKGGYDTTNMTSQDGVTILDGKLGNFNGLALSNTNSNYSSFDKIIFVRFNSSVAAGASGLKNIKFPNIGAVGCSNVGFQTTNQATAGVYIGNLTVVANGNFTSVGIGVSSLYADNIVILSGGSVGLGAVSVNRGGLIKKISVYNCFNNGIADSNGAYLPPINNAISKDGGASGVNSSGGGVTNIRRLTTSGNTTAGVNCALGSIINIGDSDLTDSTKITTDTNSWTRVNVSNYEGSPGDYRVFGNNTTLIQHDATVEHTSGKGSSKHTPSTDFDSDLPLIQKFGMVVVNSGSQTHSFWVQRSNAGGTARVVLRGGQIAGVDSDVTATISVAIDTWEKLDLTFNPTESGVPIEFEFQSYGTGDIYFADYVAP